MRSADYWRQRSEAVEAQAHARAQASIALIEQWFLEAQREVQKEIESWYARFAASEGLSLSDARKLLNSRELEEFRWTVEQYVKAGSSGDPRWAKQLENASARFHVSRLEAVQLQMQQQLERLYGNQLDEMESLFRQVAGDTYTRTAFDLMQGIGVGWDITVPDEKVLDKILSTPWTTDNATFRDRCWTMKDELRAQLQKDLTQGLMTGKPPLEISKGIEKRFGVSRYKAARLVNTETTYFNAVSSQQCYKDLDVERFEVIVTLDDTTCEICGKMDGKILPMPQYEPGVTVPPYHPNCRCTTAPAIDPEFAGERAARSDDGEVYYVPSDMTYPEWKEKFVEGGDKSGLKSISDDGIIDSGKSSLEKSDVDSSEENDTDDALPEKTPVQIILDRYPRIEGEHSYEDDIKAINPYLEESLKKGNDLYTHNCQRCVAAYEARRRGYDVIAIPKVSGNDPLARMNDEHGWPNIFENGGNCLIPCISASKEGVKKKIIEQMTSYGDGARAIVRIVRENGSGHLFIAECHEGIVHFFDPQDGSLDASAQFDYIQVDQTFLLRIDDKEFTPLIQKCCMRKIGDTYGNG